MNLAFSYMLNQTEGPLNLEKMARQMGYSKFYMLHRIKEKCGISPCQLHMILRIAKIKPGLHTGEPLLDLTYHYGFSGQSHLCNIFKKHMGLTPTQYRESYFAYASAGENVARI